VKQKTTNLCKFKGKDWVFMGCCFGGLVQQRCGFFFFFFGGVVSVVTWVYCWLSLLLLFLVSCGLQTVGIVDDKG
jgi:hypothetical protein